MNLCNDGHEEVCYEGRSCPVCAEQEKIEDLEDKIIDLKQELDDALSGE